MKNTIKKFVNFKNYEKQKIFKVMEIKKNNQ